MLQGARQNFLDTSTNAGKVKAFAMDALTDQKGRININSNQSNYDLKLLVYVPWIFKSWESVIVYLEENRQHVFYVVGFYAVTIALFIERFMRKFFF